MPALVLVRNPAAGRGAGAKRAAQITGLLRGKGIGFTEYVTTKSGNAIECSRSAVEAGAEIVLACGGDGTVSEVAQGLLGSSAALGVLPVGTGNDFSRHVGIPRDLAKAVELVVAGHTQTFDVGTWSTAEANGHFINVAGTGFDAAVADRVNRGYRSLHGVSAYLAAVLGTLRTYKAVELCLDVDGEKSTHRAMLCAVANASCYGGGMRIAPNANISDGLLDVVLVGEVSKGEFLRTFPKVFKGTHLGHPAVKSFRGKTIRIESASPLPVLCDGELIGHTPVSFGISDLKLRVLTPL